MSDITALKNQRGRIKGSVTKTQTFVAGINSMTLTDEIAVRLEKLDELWHAFTKIDDELLLKEVPSEFDEFEEKYFSIKGQLRTALNERLSRTQGSVNTPANDQFNSTMIKFFEQQKSVFDSLAQSSSSNVLDVRLPKINIPSFSGEYKEWPSFKDLFGSSVHNRASLPNVHKFQYLRSALTGEAANLIKHITISDSNYTEAWAKLIARYDKKKQILTSYIKTFIEQTSVSQTSSSALRKLTDTSDELIRGIKSLGTDASNRDPWLVYILLSKCDLETRQSWAEETADVDLPSFETLLQFLNKRCYALELIDAPTRKPAQRIIRNMHVSTSVQCPMCTQSHQLFYCPKFKAMDIPSKRTFVAQTGVCFNCLSSGHQAKKCKSKNRCHFCNKSHHSTLHTPDISTTNQVNSQYPMSSESAPHCINSLPCTSQLNPQSPAFDLCEDLCPTEEDPSHIAAFASTNSKPIRLSLLPTALVHVFDGSGSLQKCRILIDSGSQASFISEECVQRLGHQREHAKFRVTGLGASTSGFTRGSVHLSLCSRFNNNHKISVTALILSRLTSTLPAATFNIKNWYFLRDHDLADPRFNVPSKIDILLGADHVFHVLKDGNKIISPEFPVLQNSIFGYLLSGTVTTSTSQDLTAFHVDVEGVDRTLRRFWEIEEVPVQHSLYSEEEQYCENQFLNTHRIDETTGRYIVHLPLKQASPPMGETLNIATARLHSLERKLKANSTLYEEYRKFMEEYESLGHMEEMSTSDLQLDSEHAYLPHHAVLKPSSSTTKLRVVFNGSAISASGISLNQRLCVGPKTQRDLFPILLTFRTFQVAITADIEKMYRQVMIHESDRQYQRIVWRDNFEKPVRHFKLTTVTYGTAPAPFLATRALKQLGIEFKGEFPLAEHAIETSFYVDDLMSGAEDEATALRLYNELTSLLQERGFFLRKCASNSEQVLHAISGTNSSTPQKISEHSDTIKVLGLLWIPSEDSFAFDVSIPGHVTLTKRRILSETSRIFDPLGLLSPITITFKILLQQIWLKNYGWDDPIKDEVATTWENISSTLKYVKELRIPRWLRSRGNNFELHGFSDASEAAYAAAVYCRAYTLEGNVTTTLLTSKTKVSPIKQISIPRLELCGALLLAKLISAVKIALLKPNIECIAWTDSKAVLAWLSSHPSKWKCYVGNRTSEILSILPRKVWHHVYSKDNPADIATRGISASELSTSSLWWTGPYWLQASWRDYLHDESVIDQKLTMTEEIRPQFIKSFAVNVESHAIGDLFMRVSSLKKILRIIVYCFRFSSVCRKVEANNNYNWITTKELEKARNICLQWTQSCAFNEEIIALKKGGSVSPKSSLQILSPFLDPNNILRVGGRLENSLCSYDTKHPIIIPKVHIFTRLLVAYLHEKHFHAGTTLLLNIIRQTYWIVSARTVVKRHINKCIVCTRHRAITSQQLMANLPHHRASFTRPFENVGVDYAGPVMLLLHRGRGAKCSKGYICLFTCLSTRALHLELVSELTSEAFLACLKRFTSRRGLPVNIYSDNGTNFVGANRKLNEIYQIISSVHSNGIFGDFLSSNRVTWHFTPPAAPHFGGSWESGVKLVKAHIRRTIGEAKLTFEELSTFLTQVEALLNSRPLTQMSSDVDNLDVLTPAHFLIGQPMIAPPESSMESASMSTLARWRLLQKMHQDFWKRWHFEYLTTLQKRPKWASLKDNLRLEI